MTSKLSSSINTLSFSNESASYLPETDITSDITFSDADFQETHQKIVSNANLLLSILGMSLFYVVLIAWSWMLNYILSLFISLITSIHWSWSILIYIYVIATILTVSIGHVFIIYLLQLLNQSMSSYIYDRNHSDSD